MDGGALLSVGRGELQVQAKFRDFMVIDQRLCGSTACQTRDLTDSQNSWEQIWKLLVTISRGILPHDAKSRGVWVLLCGTAADWVARQQPRRLVSGWWWPSSWTCPMVARRWMATLGIFSRRPRSTS